MARLGVVLRSVGSAAAAEPAAAQPAGPLPQQEPATPSASSAAAAVKAPAGTATGIRSLDSAFEPGAQAAAGLPKGLPSEAGAERSPVLRLLRAAEEVTPPDCTAKVELVNGSAAVTEDALAPKAAVTIAAAASAQ